MRIIIAAILAYTLAAFIRWEFPLQVWDWNDFDRAFYMFVTFAICGVLTVVRV